MSADINPRSRSSDERNVARRKLARNGPDLLTNVERERAHSLASGELSENDAGAAPRHRLGFELR